MDYAVIMAGGSGTRLWPLSRQGMPKQLLPLLGGRSLLQMAFERATLVVDPAAVVVCAGRAYVDTIREQLPELRADNLLPEPVGRDSLAAVAWSTGVIRARDSDAVVAILTADHVITPLESFAAALRTALDAARAPHTLVTFGVQPTYPATGFGYLHLGAPVDPAGTVFEVRQFAEKPALAVAQGYLAAGDWRWNSGMFCWRAETFWGELTSLQPELAAAVGDLVAAPERVDDIYPGLTRTSVDYGIMEPVSAGRGASRIVAVSLDARWADVGGYPALFEQLGEAATTGTVVTLDSRRNLILNRVPGRLVAVSGVSDMIIVADEDVTLVCPFDKAESIKQLVDLAREQGESYV